jgi:hypothetical protein
LRALFALEPAAVLYAQVLRMHPLCVMLGAALALPEETRSTLPSSLASRWLRGYPLPALVVRWLEQIGFAGSIERICDGAGNVAALRQRLLARMRPSVEVHFDATRVNAALVPKLGPRKSSVAQVADLVTLSLLLAGALKLEPREKQSRDSDSPKQPNSASAIEAAFDAALRLPELSIPPQRRIAGQRPETERAIAAYVRGKFEPSNAAAAAVWGPAVEASDPSLPEELLSLYLKLKPERRPERVLGVGVDASTEEVAQAYAKRTELVSSIAAKGSSLHAAARAAELLECFDAAFEKILGGGRPSLPPEPPPHAAEPFEDKVLIGSEQEQAESPPSLAPEAEDTQLVAARITALLRQNEWRSVLETLDEWPRDRPLPFVLQLARAMAQREVARRPRVQPWALLSALLLGMACGWLAARLGGL